MKAPFILLVVLALVLIWTVWGYFSSRVEQTKYTIIEQAKGYEIREYASHLVAQTTVMGSYQDSLNKGFMILANYIFGNNTQQEKIAMTAPVTEREAEDASEKIAMTAPVTAETVDEQERIISFTMPSKYTRASLPLPRDSRIEIVEIPEKKIAALRFSWMRTERMIHRKEQKLLELLAQDGIEAIGRPVYAGYNAPWTPPWMIHNEILIEIQ